MTIRVGCINSPYDFDVYHACTGPLDELARAMEDKWGVDRLPRLMPIEVAEKFYRQARLLNEAIEKGPIADVRLHAERMMAAWRYCDKVATDAGAPVVEDKQWEVDLPDGTLLIVVRTAAELKAVERDGRKCLTITLPTMANALAGLWSDLRAKKLAEVFPGAAIERVRIPQPDWSVGDEVPF